MFVSIDVQKTAQMSTSVQKRTENSPMSPPLSEPSVSGWWMVLSDKRNRYCFHKAWLDKHIFMIKLCESALFSGGGGGGREGVFLVDLTKPLYFGCI